MDRDELNEVIARYIGHEIKRIGYMTSDDIIPAKFMEFLHTSFGKVEVVDASDILSDLRYEKSENEFKCMEQADICLLYTSRCV